MDVTTFIWTIVEERKPSLSYPNKLYIKIAPNRGTQEYVSNLNFNDATFLPRLSPSQSEDLIFLYA